MNNLLLGYLIGCVFFFLYHTINDGRVTLTGLLSSTLASLVWPFTLGFMIVRKLEAK